MVNNQNKEKSGKLYSITRQYSFDSSSQNVMAGISVEDWKNEMEKMIQNAYASGLIEYIAYIYHDRDIDDVGNHVQIHLHINVRFKKSQKQSDVRDMFNASSDQNCDTQNNALGSAKYMIHISDAALKEKKVIYSPNEVKTINCDYKELINPNYWKKQEKADIQNPLRLVEREEAISLADSIALSIKNGELMLHEALNMFEKSAGYGWLRGFRSQFEEDRKAYVQKEEQKIKDGFTDRNLMNFFITGSGGVGKSYLREQLSLKLSNKKGVHKSASGDDMMGNYTGEARLDIDELNPSTFDSIDAYNDIFDPHSHGEVASRYYDKMFIGTGFGVTNSITPLQFANDLLVYSKGGKKYQDPARKRTINKDCSITLDKYWQVRRRMNVNIVLKRDENNSELVHGYIFNLRIGLEMNDNTINYNDGTHILMGQFSFDNKHGQKPFISDDTLSYIISVMNMSTENCFTDYQTIESFLEENEMNETEQDDVIDNFIEDVVDRTVWDLLPSRFLYDIYKVYVKDLFPAEDVLSIQEFVKSLSIMLDDFEYKKDVHTTNKMNGDEPLITEFGLDINSKYDKPGEWYQKNYTGSNLVDKRDFARKNKYSGFVRL